LARDENGAGVAGVEGRDNNKKGRIAAIGGRRARVAAVPVLGVVGVQSDGSKHLLALELCSGESAAAWKGCLDDLVGRGLRAPMLCIIDGNPGLRRAVGEVWPRASVQRCCVHKLRNLERKAPKHALADPRRLPPHRLRHERRRRDHDLALLPVALEILETPPSPIGRAIGLTIIAVFVLALGWACLGTVDIVATAQGKIIPSGRTKVIQPFEIGPFTVSVAEVDHPVAAFAIKLTDGRGTLVYSGDTARCRSIEQFATSTRWSNAQCAIGRWGMGHGPPAIATNRCLALRQLLPTRAGFGVSQLYVQPVEITAKGSPSTLGRISSVSTYPVSISHKAGGTMTSRVKIRLPSGVQTDRNSQWATVKIQLAPVQTGSSIEIGVSPQNLGPGLVAHLRPAKVLVTVVGSSSAIKEAASRIHVTADVGGLGPGTYQLRPVVTAAPGLRVDSAGIYPSIVTVVVASSLQ